MWRVVIYGYSRYIEYKNRQKQLLNVRLAGGHLFGKLLFTWLSLVMSIMVSFCAVFFSHEMSWMRP